MAQPLQHCYLVLEVLLTLLIVDLELVVSFDHNFLGGARIHCDEYFCKGTLAYLLANLILLQHGHPLLQR